MQDAVAGMRQQPGWRDVILDDPEVWGVESVSSDTVVMRLVARTAPMRHWEVARELRERLKDALDETVNGHEPALAAPAAAGPSAGAGAGAGNGEQPGAPPPRTLGASHERDD